MAQNGILTNDERPVTSVNVLPTFCTFDDPFDWVIASGGDNAVIDNNIFKVYEGDRAMLITFTGDQEVVFSSGGTQMDTLIKETGRYKLSYAFDKDDPLANITFIIEVYVNNVLQSVNTLYQVLNNTNGFIDNQWNVYFGDLYLYEDEILSYRFRAQCNIVSTKLSFDRMKLELVDRGQSLPATYTRPELSYTKSKQTIDIASIPANTVHTETVSIPSAKVGYSIKVITPPEIANLGLIVPNPTVTAEGIIKMLIHNPTGGAINLASLDYIFLINEV